MKAIEQFGANYFDVNWGRSCVSCVAIYFAVHDG